MCLYSCGELFINAGAICNQSRMSLSKGTSAGDEWKGRIYFDCNADSTDGSRYFIKKDRIVSRLKALLDTEGENDTICNIWVYKTPLIDFSLTNVFLYHSFVVYETYNWCRDLNKFIQFWWSIEKNSEGITIQRGEKKTSVVNKYRQKHRPTTLLWWAPVEVIHDTGRKTMGELVDILVTENLLNDQYDLINSNCKHFAKVLFDEVAKLFRYLMNIFTGCISQALEVE